MRDGPKWRTLFHPFEAGLLADPGPDTRWLFSGALQGFVLPDGFTARLTCLQGNRADFLGLEKLGCDVAPELPPDARFDGALVLLGRYRQDNIRRLHEAAGCLRPGGLLVVAGAKTDGVDPLRKRMRVLEAGHAAKHHGVVFWLERPPEGLGDVLPAPAEPIVVDGMSIPPGAFSADGPDPGSVLLSDHFASRLGGKIADFGAGWGYLGVMALRQCDAIESLHSYEADWRSLQACRANVDAAANGRQVECVWADLLSEPPGSRLFDWIVMNPPFHHGRAAEPDIGAGFIAAAARSLKPGGRLLMVANRQLPYEAVLDREFAKVEWLAEDGGYKICEARR